ncbi:DUF3234 domain-containing protein [Oceanithermus desulfurans]
MDTDFFEAVWYVLTDPARAGEHLTLTAAEVKYALVWTSSKVALEFSREVAAARGMKVTPLYSWTLKEAFLTAAEYLGAGHLLIDYRQGQLQAAALPVAVARERLGPETGNAQP